MQLNRIITHIYRTILSEKWHSGFGGKPSLDQLFQVRDLENRVKNCHFFCNFVHNPSKTSYYLGTVQDLNVKCVQLASHVSIVSNAGRFS